MRFTSRFVQARPFVVLALILLAWLLVPPVLKSLLRLSFFELQAPAVFAASHVRDLQDYWTLRTRSKHELLEAARDLTRLNASYELRLQEYDALALEVRRLERLLGLPPRPDYHYEIARVSLRDQSAWWQQLLIRKGKNDGIAVGAPVVYSGGVVGRISEVHATTSLVDLVSSPTVRLAAAIEGDPRPVSYQGAGAPPFQPATGRVDHVPPDLSASESGALRLVTSGLGGVFPPGLTIGWVREMEPGSDGLFQSGSVQLDRRLNNLREVAVLVPINPEHRP